MILHAKNFTAHVATPDAEDRDVILELHDLGHAFENAVGAYLADHPSLFPKGTFSKVITAEEQDFIDSVTNDRSNISHDLSYDEMADHAAYYSLHLHCMFMQTEERYLRSLNVSFKDVADSVNVDVSDKTAIDRKLAVCEKYDLKPMARLLNMKLAA